MNRTVELGVFLPVTNNGWIMSATSPQFMPSFALNREVGALAEQIGFDYLFAMAKWRGYGGATDFWKHALESTMLIGGLGAAIPRLRLFASVAPALIHPAVFAKIAATLDDVTGGRLGINIVSAGNKGEYTQMGLYPENFESFRYDYTEEWLTVVKRLWSEDGVTHRGRFFTLDDCQSWPKPVQPAVPIVCATSSDRGYRFVAEHCTDGFFGGGSFAMQVERGRRIKAVAAEHGRPVRTHTLTMLIQADTDAAAEALVERYLAGVDREAIATVYTTGAGEDYERRDGRLFIGGAPIVGDAQRVSDEIERLAVEADVDGIMFVFPDFVDGLQRFGDAVMPLLRRRGVHP
jgi:pyrimidine oxygenase